MVDIRERLTGAFTALVTPTDGQNSVDEESLRKLCRYVLAGGINGLVVLGSCGEMQAISDAERKRAIRIVVEEAKGKVHVLAGGGDTDVSRAVQNVETARELGADAALVVAPYYYLLSQQALINYYTELAKLNFPILLYNIPNFCKIRIDPPTVRALSRVDNIVGIKDSSFDFQYLQELVLRNDRAGSFRVFVGTDALLLAGLTLGVDGVIGVTSNIVPSWDIELTRAYRAGDLLKAREVQNRITRVLEILRLGNFPSGVKEAAALKGLCAPKMWKPATELTAQEANQMRERLREMNVL